MKITVEKIWRNLALLTLVCTILFHPDFTTNTYFLHEFADGLMVNDIATVVHLIGDSTITITPFVFLKDLGDKLAFVCPSI